MREKKKTRLKSLLNIYERISILSKEKKSRIQK